MSTTPDAPATQPAPEQPRPARGLTRRGWTVVLGTLLTLVFLVAGLFVPIPYVSLGPGPTYDTLGSIEDVQIVSVDGEQTYPTTGQLRMTTVSVNDEVTLFGAMGLWVSGRYALAPREEYFRPGETEEDITKQNTKLFQDSQSDAETAALRYLRYPTRVIAAQITAGAPADKVLKPGDQLVTVNGKAISTAAEVRGALTGTKPGDSVSIGFQRDGVDTTTSVTLGKASDFGAEERAEGFLGLGPADRPDVPFKTSISLENVGGPSAGLMFSLAIVDRLTPGDLAGGHTIAGTGEIDPEGAVGRIGGIQFKLVGAREAGVTTFLVPEGNCDEARAATPEGLQLLKVGTLTEAVTQLENLKAGRPTVGC
ncbi:YlbL family protein [Actinokineospora sp. G85]|uniref:YlbL family protein n=1 Tax=Actinokineospora sp. G85 TaxID=3406626 RepID=UPI003C730968